ncbi:MAG TPA: hypothetical protein VGP83_17260 [Pyrinomonadaceae bacterium]|jgi:hypothetical protein|nr:hypothetical protein [Pyrinomonadaceae bacterium]
MKNLESGSTSLSATAWVYRETHQSICIHQKRSEPYIEEKQIVILNAEEMWELYQYLQRVLEVER